MDAVTKEKMRQALVDVGLDSADFHEDNLLILYQNGYHNARALKVAREESLMKINLSPAAIDLVLSLKRQGAGAGSGPVSIDSDPVVEFLKEGFQRLVASMSGSKWSPTPSMLEKED